MNKLLLMAIALSFFIFLNTSIGLAIDVAPRISDREIIEKLSRLEEGQKKLENRFDAVDKRFDDLRSEINSRFEAMDKRFEAMDKRFEAVDKRFDDLRSEMNNRFSDMNSRFDQLTWMFGLFVTISMVILGFVIRMQWQMQKRQSTMETSLETQKDELRFFKGLIEKLLPPRGAL